MIHAKSLIRRLAYVPWLLAAGLVLGWAGEAAAQITAIKLELSKSSVREDAGATDITVTATATGMDASNATAVAVIIPNEPDSGLDKLNARFRIELPTIVIPANAASATGKLKFTPINDEKRGDNFKDDGIADDLVITIGGVAGAIDVTPTTLTLQDDDKLSTNLKLSFEPGAGLSNEVGSTPVTVTATLDGDPSNSDHTFNLVFTNPAGVHEEDIPEGLLSDTASYADSILTRDTDYDATPAPLRLDRGEMEATTTISIDPKETKTAKTYIALNVAGADIRPATGGGPDTLIVKGIDLNNNGVFNTFKLNSSNQLTESLLGLAFDDNSDNDLALSEDRLGISLSDETGTNVFVFTADDEGISGESGSLELREADLTYKLTFQPGFFPINDTPIADVLSDGLSVAPASIREEVGPKTIELTVTLKSAVSAPTPVSFEIVSIDDPATDDVEAHGTRDIDYTVSLDEELTIPKDETTGTTTLTLTPTNDEGIGDKWFTVIATVNDGDTPGKKRITITDDETLTDEITLTVDPSEIHVGNDDEDNVTVTGTLNGKTFDKDVTLTLIIDDSDATTAQRDTDYRADLHSSLLMIPAGEVSASETVTINPIKGGDKKVALKALETDIKNQDEETVSVTNEKAVVTLKDAVATTDPDPDPPEPEGLAFDEDSVDPISGTVGTAITPVELPAASGGTEPLRYAVAGLPAGLSFDAATRTISGTPAAETEGPVVYTVLDSEDESESDALTFTIKIDEAPAPMVEVAELTSTHESIRENGETTAITLTVTLAEASATDEKVNFTLGAPSAGALAVRDVDYTAVLGGTITIAAGETTQTTTLILTPIDNPEVDGNKFLGVKAEAASGGSSKLKNIQISDDETPSTSISLEVSPDTVSEAAGETPITVTATLDGKERDADAEVIIEIDGASVATRDVDYSARFNPLLVIPAGLTSGRIVLFIDPIADVKDEGTETITLNGTIEGLMGGSTTITLSDSEEPEPEPEPELAFAEGTVIEDIEVTAGWEMKAVVLPAAEGGSGDISYSVSDLPAGLDWDAATRTISGTPDAATDGAVEVTYTATDGAGETAEPLTFSITVNAALDFGDFFGQFNGGAGKANPASEHDDGVREIVVGQPYSLTLPEVFSGGTPPFTYSVSGLPAGLSFDAATRTISGTPTELIEAVVVTYTVTDASGASNSVPFLVAVIEPPLDAPDALVAEDYKGADGAGDQGGFVLLTWYLSDDHDTLDGYRIFREMPVLEGAYMPWAFVDAVPGVTKGYAIVATIDQDSTQWGIAAQRGHQITEIVKTESTEEVDAKAAFVRADDMNQPYELMAETLMASREAAHAGDAPVFASLLPEALAFAQGVAPKLNSVEGVLEISAITITEERVRAIDDIAPEAVPSLRVLDAPNDEGSRIALTWTRSPSDQLLQGVVAGAIGAGAVEPVVGVHGYGIYRRAAGEDEFVLVAQVEAGVTSFVDETALNGVRYTYQVRPYDLDNETGSELEPTALAVRNRVVDSEGRALVGLFGADNRVGFDDFFILADFFGLTAEDVGFDPAFDLAPSAAIDFDDFFVFADHFGRSTAAAGKRVPLLAGLNAEARLYLDAPTALPSVGEDFVLDVRMADFVAVKGYGLQVEYDADKLEFVEALTDQPLGGSALAAPQVLSDEAGVLALAAHGAVVADGEVGLRLVFRPTTAIESTVIELTDGQTYDSVGFNRLALPAPVALQTRPSVFALAANYPNPFNPATTIRYALPQAADVELTVYNVVGQPVRTLVAEPQRAGRYVVEWDATNDSGQSLSSGLYFYRLQAGDEFRAVKKMLLLK